MSEILLNFDRPLHDIVIESPRGVTPTITTTPDKDAEKKQQQQTEQLQDILHAIQTQLSTISATLDRTQANTKDLVLQNSVRFTELFFTHDKELILSRLKHQLSAGLDEMNLAVDVNVWVHPDCVELVKVQLANHDVARLTIAADPQLQPGDIRLEGPEQGLIGRLERQLEHARTVMLSQIHEAPA